MPDAAANGLYSAASWRRSATASLVALCFMSLSAQAQTASSVTPESFQPPLRNLSGAVVLTGQTGTQAPPGSDQIGITLSGVTIAGAFPQMAAADAAFKARLTRGRIPVSELFDATSELEAAYTKAGFALARVVLPQQALRDGGTLRVEVVDGYVETVDISRVPPEVRRRIESLTSPLVGQRGLTMTELERQLLLAGDVSGVALGSALAAGHQPGSTVIAQHVLGQHQVGKIQFPDLVVQTVGAHDHLLGKALFVCGKFCRQPAKAAIRGLRIIS